MANLIQINNVSNRYSKNLFSELSLISDNTDINYNYNTVSGGYILSDVDSFSGVSKALKAEVLQNVESGFNVSFDFGDALEFIAPETGVYIYQNSIKFNSINANNNTYVNFNVNVYINSVLVHTFTNEINLSDYELRKYYTFGQSFSLNDGDVVNFAFELQRDSIGTPNPNFTICVDGFKLEKNIYNIGEVGIPSFYSLPQEEQATGYESKSDTSNIISLTADIDNLVSITSESEENGGLKLLNTNAKITPIKLGDVLIVDFACTFVTPPGTDKNVVIKLMVDGIAYRSFTYPLTKGEGNDDEFSISWSLPCGQSLIDNGAEIYINPMEAMTNKNRYISVTRIHKGI